ncbi:metallophosphoesterase [Bacillus sp. SCS-151]|uniref:metallophosphoesterase n=1 Tax=Nanhaiella sioensis TaxID=3115293 RepID=UPI00397C706D
MKRILAISDVHGCNDEFLKLLDKANYNSETDQLILLGDYEDRGLKSKDVINQIIDLQNKGAISLRGNHDQMFLD